MAYEISPVSVWVGTLEDRPGELARVLGTLWRAGANLEFLSVRPDEYQLGSSALFVAPLEGPALAEAAAGVGLRTSKSLHVLRVVVPDRPGLLSDLAEELAEAGVNILGLTGTSLRGDSVLFLRFLGPEELELAAQVLRRRLTTNGV
jgi:hypothetical protein